MYAAAGGASIANRRKQKRLQLKKDGAGAAAAAARARSLSAHPPIGQQHGKPAGQHVVPSLQLSQPGQVVQPSYGFHSSQEHHRTRGQYRRYIERKAASAGSQNYHNNNNNNNRQNRGRLLAPPPISPIIQFPISPPPLSLESPNSLTANVTQAITSKTNLYGNSNSTAAVAFPFPPPSFLDLRVSPSNSELQAALLIRREKQRLRGGKAVNFRELPSNLATRLIPPLPRYPPRSYVYGCGGQGPGKAAWQGCARPSPLPLSPASPQGSRGEGYKTKQCEAHRRWMKKNRIRDASYCYGSSEDDDCEEYEEDVAGGPGGGYDGRASRRRVGEVSAAVNTVLYAGLGTTALGLVISFVGTGEKGFLSPELRLVGPSLLCAGLLCCLLRVLLCLCLCRCCGECRWRPCGFVPVSKDAKALRPDKPKLPTSRSERAIPAPSLPARSHHRQPATASLLPINPPSSSQRQQTPVPSSSSCSTAKSHKGHELLLSPAQLPE